MKGSLAVRERMEDSRFCVLLKLSPLCMAEVVRLDSETILVAMLWAICFLTFSITAAFAASMSPAVAVTLR